MGDAAVRLDFVGDVWYQRVLTRASFYADEDSPIDREIIRRVTEYFEAHDDDVPTPTGGGTHACAVYRAGSEIVVDPDAEPRDEYPGPLWTRGDDNE